MENDGHQVFQEHLIITAASPFQYVVPADLDGDGDRDVLSASSGDSKIAWYENNGSQVFAERALIRSASGAKSAVAADLDADGDLDVLYASLLDDTVAWFKNQNVHSPSVIGLSPADAMENQAPGIVVGAFATADPDAGDTFAYLFDPTGEWNVNDALGTGAARTTREQIRAYLDDLNPGVSPAPRMTVSAAAQAAAFLLQSPPPIPSGVSGLAATQTESASSQRNGQPERVLAVDLALRSWERTSAFDVGVDRALEPGAIPDDEDAAGELWTEADRASLQVLPGSRKATQISDQFPGTGMG